jgi:hypothetical protein
LAGFATAAQSSGSKLPRHKIKSYQSYQSYQSNQSNQSCQGAQATLAFNALRNAISNFTMSCGSSRCGTFTSAMFSSL